MGTIASSNLKIRSGLVYNVHQSRPPLFLSEGKLGIHECGFLEEVGEEWRICGISQPVSNLYTKLPLHAARQSGILERAKS